MPPFDATRQDGSQDGPGGAVEELTVRAAVNGTTVMATYVVKGSTLLLASADFGDASAGLDGQAPEVAAARLRQEMTGAAMARGGARFMRDDEASGPGA